MSKVHVQALGVTGARTLVPEPCLRAVRRIGEHATKHEGAITAFDLEAPADYLGCEVGKVKTIAGAMPGTRESRWRSCRITAARAPGVLPLILIYL
jgi:hypothetical protein